MAGVIDFFFFLLLSVSCIAFVALARSCATRHEAVRVIRSLLLLVVFLASESYGRRPRSESA